MKKLSCVGLLVWLVSGSYAQEVSEPYLSDSDQKAFLDKETDKAIERDISAQRQSDVKKPKSYVVRIEIFSRRQGQEVHPYVKTGDLSLEDGFLFWAHDGRNPDGYAVYLYPEKKGKSRIKKTPGTRLVYGKSFASAAQAISEIESGKSGFRSLVNYEPLIMRMKEKLKAEPYVKGGSE